MTRYKIRKPMVIFGIFLCIVLIGILTFYKVYPMATTSSVDEEYVLIVDQSFSIRNRAILNGNRDSLDDLYDQSKRYGQWALEHELKKMKYLHIWSEKQGITFVSINSKPTIRWVKEKGAGIVVNLHTSTEYQYIYNDDPKKLNAFRIGTYHSLDMVEKDGLWKITREWYTDPFADSLNLKNEKSKDIKDYILSQSSRDLSGISERRKRAVEYADKYVGAADDGHNDYKYSRKYKDYNSLGGDCANFASQILYEAGKFRKTGTWNYSNGGSKAWVNAQAFKNYMVGSGRASVVAYGSYEKVYKASYKLLPGDFVAYEKKGKITHISTITGADSKGYSLVNCHNTDRYRVPWDLGWSNKGIRFWLVRVHY